MNPLLMSLLGQGGGPQAPVDPNQAPMQTPQKPFYSQSPDQFMLMLMLMDQMGGGLGGGGGGGQTGNTAIDAFNAARSLQSGRQKRGMMDALMGGGTAGWGSAGYSGGGGYPSTVPTGQGMVIGGGF